MHKVSVTGRIILAFIWQSLVIGGVLKMQSLDVIIGGWQWQAAGYALLESFFGVGMSIGLLALFKEKCNQQRRFWQTLADNSFAVYVFSCTAYHHADAAAARAAFKAHSLV